MIMSKPINCLAQQSVVDDAFTPVRLLDTQGTEGPARRQQPLFLKDDALAFVTAGPVQYRHGGELHVLHQYQFVFFRRGVLLELLPLLPQTQLLFFVVKRELVLQFAEMGRKPMPGNGGGKPVMRGEADGVLIDFCHQLAGRLQQDGDLPGPLVTIKLLELLFLLSRSHPAMVEQMMDCRDRCLPDIPAIVEEKLMDDVPLSQLARMAGRSVSSFRRDFLAIYNMAPSRYIRQKKLEKAQQLLINTNMTITEVCYLMGFQSNAHFSRIYKSHFGYRPSDGRRPAIIEKGVNLS